MPSLKELPIPSFPALAYRLSVFRCQAATRRALSSLGFRRPAHYYLSQIILPHSAVVEKATSLVAEVSPQFLLNHGLRTYLFAAALGLRDGRGFDAEALYLASIMHDLGFTSYCLDDKPFELSGADAAYDFAVANGVENQRADLIHEAIALHTSLGLRNRSAEVVLVQEGSSLDMVGLRMEDLAPETVRDIVTAHPRLGIKEQMLALAQQKVVGRHGCPLAILMRLGFTKFVEAAPFAE